MPLIKKSSIGPTRAQQVHRIWATKTLCGPRFVCVRVFRPAPRGNNNNNTAMQQQ